jgi:tRNA pseudouridine55 synthase
MEVEFPFAIITERPFHDFTLEDILEGQVLLVDKPLTWSSFQVVNKIKHAIKKKFKVKKFKIGHAGTLDPLATGLLIICTGKKTKEIPLFQDQSKEYTGTIRLGGTTPSYDLETEVDATFPIEHITPLHLTEALEKFKGEILQYPPVFSAVKVDGRRAYKSARQGIEVEVKQRQVSIHNIEIDSQNFPDIHFKVHCSKGTYIRSLAFDFGAALNSGGHLVALRRTKIGAFSVDGQ